MKYYLIIFPLLLLASCKENTDKKNVSPDSSTLTINLPFESCNFADNINFILYDHSGKKCIASLDTITKGGGTILYEDIPNGIYSYSLRTVFNDTISKELTLDSSTWLDFYHDCYDVRDAIDLETLQASEKIDLIAETMNGTDSTETDAFRFYKKGSHYLISHNFKRNDGWSNPYIADSAVVINSLAEFEMTVIGLQALGIKEKNSANDVDTHVYLKCNDQFLEIAGIDNKRLLTAFEILKKSLLK